MPIERSCSLLQLSSERHQLDHLLLRVGDLVCHEAAESILDRSARSTIPGGRELGDLVEAAPELLGAPDELQPFQRPVVIEPVSGFSSGGLRAGARSLRSSAGWPA